MFNAGTIAAAAQPWTPDLLFKRGEQGVWYDPSDIERYMAPGKLDTATMFQDALGTTPVTAVEQPVGLILDKRFGGARGPELIVNGDFSAGSTGWILAAGVAIIDGQAVFDGTTYQPVSTDLVKNTVPSVPGKTYEIAFSVTGTTNNDISIMCGNTPGPTVNTAGKYKVVLRAYDSTGFYIRARGANGIRTGGVDNISVRELPGNHASQATTTARPVLSARKNWVMRDSDTGTGTGSGWSGSSGVTVAASSMFTPGGVRATKLLATDVANQQLWAAATAVTLPAGSSCSVSVTAKAGELPCMGVTSWDGKTYFISTLFDLVNGVVKSGTGRMVDLGGGWWRCIVENRQRAVDSNQNPLFQLRPARSSDTAATTSGPFTPGEGFYFAEMDVEFSPTATRYQRVTSDTDYDWQGWPLYLRFDGVDDSLQTGGIDFTATDKMTVVAGVRKLSDAAIMSIAELSAQYDSNNGSFMLRAPSGVESGNYGYYCRGSLNSGAVTAAASYPAPSTNIISTSSSITGDMATIRIDGAQVATSAADQGAGTYGNYPLYIGRRGGTSLPFNGYLYQLGIRGAATNAEQLRVWEKAVAKKTGVNL